MSKRQSEKALKTVKGVLQVPYEGAKGNDSDYSDEEDEDLDDMFAYVTDFSTLSNFVSMRVPKETKVNIKSHDGKIHPCSGRFPLTQTFWEVEAKVANGYLKQAPKYYILNDPVKCRDFNLVNIFISECFKREKGAGYEENAAKACFEAYCRCLGIQEKLGFENLEIIFKEYLKEEKLGCCIGKFGENGNFQHGIKDHSNCMMNHVIGSELGAVVLLAASHPKMVSTLSELLPYSFTQFLHKLKPTSHFRSARRLPDPSEDLKVAAKKALFMATASVDPKVQVADKMARERPWEFAFKAIVGTNLRVYGTEAKLQVLKQAGYLARTPQKESDAMHIYEVLKEDARRYGNMYVELDRLKQSAILQSLKHTIVGDKRWNDALDYLEGNKVIKVEVFNNRRNIFLLPNWQAEVDTVKAMNVILFRHKQEPLQWSIDMSSPDFKHLQRDENQRRATQLVCQMPITVLSGKGGCGKTTVITKLLEHLCRREEDRLQEERKLYESLSEPFDTSQTDHSTIDKNLPEKLPQNVSSQGASEQVLQKFSKAELVTANKAGVPVEVSNVEKLRRQVVSDLITILENSKNEDSLELEDFKKQFLLTAPTGKAARLLGRKANLPSATLHSVSMSWRSFNMRNVPGESWSYERVQVLVVDECSLVSVRLFAAAVNILLEGANLRKIVLLGDVRQLPSIEPGEFLKDIFRSFHNVSGDSFGFSIELTQNHRSESELIVENASRISNRQMPTFDPNRRFHLKNISDYRDDNQRDEAIRQLLRNFEDVKSDLDSQFVAFRNAHCQAVNELCCQFYNHHSIAAGSHGKKIKLDFRIGDKICLGKNNLVMNARKMLLERYLGDYQDLRDAHVRTGQRNDSADGRGKRENFEKTALDDQSALDLINQDEDVYNRTMQEMILNDMQAEERRQAESKQPSEKSVKKEEKPRRCLAESLIGEDREKLCNGEVFFIMDEIDRIDENGQVVKYLVLSDRDRDLPRVVCVPLRQLRRLCRMKHSWARTIHTYQGSESDTVVYILGKAIPQNWQHVYTAITRGKKSVGIVGSYSELLVAIERREPARNTRLGHRLNEMIAGHSDLIKKSKEDFTSISNCVPSPNCSLSQLSDLSESFIHELDETVARFSSKCSAENRKPTSDLKDDFSELSLPGDDFEVDAAETNLAKPNNIDSGVAKVDARPRDSDLFSLSSWDGNEDSDDIGVTVSQSAKKSVQFSKVNAEESFIVDSSDTDGANVTFSEPTKASVRPYTVPPEESLVAMRPDTGDVSATFSSSQSTQMAVWPNDVSAEESFITSVPDSDMDDNEAAGFQPRHNSVPKVDAEESCSSCSDDSDIGEQHRLFRSKRTQRTKAEMSLITSSSDGQRNNDKVTSFQPTHNTFPGGALDSPPASAKRLNSNNRGDVTPPDQKGPNPSSTSLGEVSPSKKVCRNILSTPFQEKFKSSLNLRKGGVVKKL